MKVVCDTGPLIALHDASESLHPIVRDLARRDDIDLVLPDPVIVETEWLLRNRLSPLAATVFLDDVVAGGYERVQLDDLAFSRSTAYEKTYDALNIGLVDASV